MNLARQLLCACAASALLVGGAPPLLAQEQQAPATTIPAASSETRSVAAGWGEGSDWSDQHAQIVQLAGTRRVDVALLGDSITQGFGDPGRRLQGTAGRAAFDRVLAPLRAANLGISGDRTQNVLWRVANGELDGLAPKVVVLSIGTNNLTAGDSPADVVAGTGAIVAAIRAKLPDAQLLLLGVFPRGEHHDDPLRAQVDAVNRGVAALADARHVRFLDLARTFLRGDGDADPNLYAGDFLHLQAAGYEAWADALAHPLRLLLDVALREAAARVVPSARQLAWQELEFAAFVHFGINTFTDREWGDGSEDPRAFAPSDLDAEQWVLAFKDAGMRLVILTCKHHDGFCLWPSALTDHSVKSSPWKDGKGDVVRDLSQACAKHGMKFGVYLSPADLHEPSYGDSPRYDAFFLGQLRELLTNYGAIAEVWFDGATPKDKGQVHDWPAYYKLIRELQPGAVIFGRGPDVRWVGNEAGQGRASEWSVVALDETRGPIDTTPTPDLTDEDLGGLAKLRTANALHWYPAETDTSIRPGWFWHEAENDRVRSLDDLMNCWYGAVGGNSQLLLNVPADRRGRIADGDVKRLHEIGRVVRATFGSDLARAAKVTASSTSIEPGFGGGNLTDGNLATAWRAADGAREAELQVDLGGERTFNRVSLREAIEHGQRIEEFAVDAWRDGDFQEIAHATTIGHRRILRCADVTTSKVRIRLERSRLEPLLSDVGLFFEPPRLAPPVVRRGRDGLVTVDAPPDADVLVSVSRAGDAEPPGGVAAAATKYEQPFALPRGGVVTATALARPGARVLELEPRGGARATTKVEFGPAKTKWKVVAVDSEETAAENGAAQNAIDDDPRTFWHTQWSKASPGHPHSLTIDFGEELEVAAFTYLPRQGASLNGTARHFAVYVLATADAPDPKVAPTATGEFANVAAHPVEQVVRFAKPVRGRWLRFVALDEISGRPWSSAAELGIRLR